MRSSKKNIALVIPCFNEFDRLNVEEYLKYSAEDLRLVFVDDGSDDDTYDMLAKLGSNYCEVIRLDSNQGKAEAVRQGMLYCQSQSWFESLDWVGYWDADLATPLWEIQNFDLYCRTFYDQPDAIFGSRVQRYGGYINRSATRHYLGRIFATVNNLLFNLSCYDTQCGAKLFSRKATEKIFTDRFISRWCFDVELILRLRAFRVVEYPLQKWDDVQGSKLNILKVAFPVFLDLMKIFKTYR